MKRCIECGCRMPSNYQGKEPCKFCRETKFETGTIDKRKTNVAVIHAGSTGTLKPSYIDGKRCN